MVGATRITTKEVARLLDVSEATVKRWAENGSLPSERTLGGHRRFSLHSIASLRRERKLGNETAASPSGEALKTKAKPLIKAEAFRDLILEGGELEAGAALMDAYLQDHELASIFDSTVAVAMHHVGELWFKGEISIAEEHLATQLVLSALEKLRGVIVPGKQTGLTAVTCGIEGDLHELPVHLVQVILESEGCEVLNLGPNTPLFALHEMIKDKKSDLVCIAARSINDLGRAAIEYEQLQKTASKIGTTVIVGGEAFRDSTMRARFPAELHATNFEAFSQFLRAWVEKRSTLE